MLVESLLAVLTVGSAEATTTEFVFYDFVTGQESVHQNTAEALDYVDGHYGALGGEPLELPTLAPDLPRRGSQSSVMVRARDVFDTTAYPARAVAKSFMMDETGNPTGQACTVQFVGPRHLITALHCLVEEQAFVPGQEIAIGFDDGETREGTAHVPITGLWATPTHLLQFRGTDEQRRDLVLGEECNDVAIIEISEPLGEQLGWLPIRSAPTDSFDGLLHAFSYPQRARTDSMRATMESDEDMPPIVREAFAEIIADMEPHVPEFSPDNLYYSYGTADEQTQHKFHFVTRYSLSGTSGGAYIDENNAVMAIHSTWANDYANACRLTPEWVGAVAEIISAE